MRIKWGFNLIICLFLQSVLISQPPSIDKRYARSQTICLNMIVKNESAVIQRCLNSVKNFIDYWVIVDTGSTDGTQQMILECMEGIPGELHERPWVHFAHNRNEALAFAKKKADYVLFIDADEELVPSDLFMIPPLDKDCYHIYIREAGVIDSQRTFLINNHLDWSWEGVVHEIISSPQAKSLDFMQEIKILCHQGDGYRSRSGDKYLQDAQVLEAALEQDPTNRRYIFYLAQSYANAKNFSLALKNYERRVALGGGEDGEIFWSLYCMGRAQEDLNMNSDIIIQSYSQAYQYRPTRIEPLYRLGSFLRRHESYLLASIILKYALSHPLPQDHFNIEQWIYDYGLLLELANCAFWLGNYEEACYFCELILAKKEIPLEIKNLANSNLQCAYQHKSTISKSMLTK